MVLCALLLPIIVVVAVALVLVKLFLVRALENIRIPQPSHLGLGVLH